MSKPFNDFDKKINAFWLGSFHNDKKTKNKPKGKEAEAFAEAFAEVGEVEVEGEGEDMIKKKVK